MAHLVHRQRVTGRRPEPKGVAAIRASVSRTGAILAVLGLGYFLLGLQPFLTTGAMEGADPRKVVLYLLSRLGSAALIALLPAMEIGFPRVRRRNPSLWRGALLLAIQPVLRPTISLLMNQLGNINPGLATALSDTSQLGGLALAILNLSLSLPTISGALSLSTGLGRAGANPPMILRVIAVVAAPVLVYFTFDAVLAQVLDFSAVTGYLNVIALVVMVLTVAVWLLVAVRLVMGPKDGTVPGGAWFIGFLAGTLLLMERIGQMAIAHFDPQGANILLATLVTGAGAINPMVLSLAFLMGMARGTRRRRIHPRPIRLFVLNPTA